MSRKNQVIIVSSQDTTRHQFVSRIKADTTGIVTGKWNGKKVVFVKGNIWQVAE